MKKSALIALFSTFLFQGCIDHGNGKGVSTSNLLTYSTTTVEEADSNDGTFNAEIEVTLKGDVFAQSLVAGDAYDTINQPEGLDVEFTRVSDTKGIIAITGQATTHSGCGDGTIMSFFFNNSAFEGRLLPIAFEIPIKIKFIKPVLNFSTTTLVEDSANNGSFTQSITITAEGGGTFSHLGPMVDGVDYEWTDVPDSLVSTLTATDTDADTLADTVTAILTSSADDHTPIEDTLSTLKFLGDGLSSDFCSSDAKKQVKLKFYRSIIMYSATAATGNLNGRTGADGLCVAARPSGLPVDYVNYRAFISIDGTDEIRDMPANYGVPTDKIIESASSGQIKANWIDLLADGTIDTDLDTADITDDIVMTGSDPNGVLAANCDNWTSALMGDSGQIGATGATDSTWIDDGTQTCNNGGQVLCITFTD